MKDLIGAIKEEKCYISDRMNNINTSLLQRIIPFGYNALNEYFLEKREYLFNQWNPEIYPIDVRNLTTELENAVQNEKYGIYISIADGLYAFHGSDEIDYELCDELGVYVAELYHQGGTIIGSSADIGIEIVAPSYIGLDADYIIKKFHGIISKYIDNVSISGNDILIDDKKVMGSMRRDVGKVFVWAAQISFGDYTEIIEQVCNKKSVKVPSHIDNTKLSRDLLYKEIIKWLQKH